MGLAEKTNPSHQFRLCNLRLNRGCPKDIRANQKNRGTLTHCSTRTCKSKIRIYRIFPSLCHTNNCLQNQFMCIQKRQAHRTLSHRSRIQELQYQGHRLNQQLETVMNRHNHSRSIHFSNLYCHKRLLPPVDCQRRQLHLQSKQEQKSKKLIALFSFCFRLFSLSKSDFINHQ